MNKKFITVIILLLSLSLVGAVALQGLWINNEWQSKRENFDRDVQDALNTVADRLEKQETASFLSHRFDFGTRPRVFVSNGHADSGWLSTGSFTHTHVEFHSHSIYDIFDTLHKQTEAFVVADTGNDKQVNADSQHVLVTQFEVGSNLSDPMHQRISAKSQQLNNVLNEMVMEWSMFNIPVEKRLDIYSLHEMIRQEFMKKGIQLPFQFGVMSGNNQNVVNVHSPQFSTQMIPASFSAPLFPNDITFRSDRLLVFFDDVRPYFMRSLWWMILLSALMSLIFAGTFGTAIYVILKQKKLSEIKTDFINNMTHEFKTPIATISLALDSINNPRVVDDKARVHYYTDIIGRENMRMNVQVEHILQMALLDKENFELNEQLLNVHELIEQVADHFQFQIESRGGSLKLDLNATNPYVLADEIHITNVFHNLFDNANKYSTQSPDITVETRNEKDGIVISVQDHGLGMSAETQRKIFEKFYRAQNGNIHDVKGFGLGLAYVKTIVVKHNGRISVKSEPGNGSRFEIYFPYGHQQKSDSLIRA
ncbi:MAG TPA: HAMP domain-containing sensor histidine kinase [Chitinophagales bacterium]|nr:HAMP domain-containing sensor histidine kinase [Chitinophagales bacterium]